MKWAVLLHDIKKCGPPHFIGKDHTHPFKGGKAVLEVFHRMGLISGRNEGEGDSIEYR